MTSFAPLIAEDPKILILGSMPSQISLKEQQYYGNPQNAFWWLMSELLGFDLALSYSQRVQHLTSAGVAVWDVLRDCERPGSLDSSIVRSSELPNDIAPLLKQSPGISLIAFNGGTAKAIFKRHCAKCLQQHDKINCVQLPSSSPAYASISKFDKLALWREAFIEHL